MSHLNRDLLDERSPNRDFLLLLAVSRNHFLESILKQIPAFFQGLPLGDHLGPLDQLAHVAGRNLRVLGGVGLQHAILLPWLSRGCTSRPGMVTRPGFTGCLECRWPPLALILCVKGGLK